MATIESPPTAICTLCEATFQSPRQRCSNCEGNLVVPVDESEVYETVLPMLDPNYHVTQTGEEE